MRAAATERTKPTLVDVARLAGVSLATASRVLNGHPSVGLERAVRVRAAVQGLGYVVDATARTISGGASSTLAIVLVESDKPVSVALIQGASEAASGYDLAVLVATVDPSRARRGAVIQRLRAHRPRCIVVVGSKQDLDHDPELSLALNGYERHGGQVIWVSPPAQAGLCESDFHLTSRRWGMNAVVTAVEGSAHSAAASHDERRGSRTP